MTIKQINTQYTTACNAFVKAFCKKQGLEFDGWVGDEVGGIASFIHQYFFNLSDIVLDLNTRQPKGLILNWQTDGVDFNMFKENPHYINYKSYTLGLRYENLENQNQQQQ